MRSRGTRVTRRSTSVVLPVPDGAETMKSSPRSLDILDLLAHLFELGLRGDHDLADTPVPSAFDATVLTSRFISCSRKSSLRPHGSSDDDERLPVREMGAEPRDLLADVGPSRHAHDLLRDHRLIDRQLQARLPEALEQAGLEAGPPLARAEPDPLDQLRRAAGGAPRGRPAGARPPARASRRGRPARVRRPPRRCRRAAPPATGPARPAGRAP